MKRKHVQAELAPSEYRALDTTAVHEHMTIKEALREAALDWIARKGIVRDPIYDIVGIVPAGPGQDHASRNHDEDYLED